ncbi:hypothetical protein PUMCH_003229 [Australozyma saopauloensis]|uniref:Mitotic check point protein BFA1 n=1 Tax=Australozyma saopauloensis TaxID=291208 RepID=A0AAX4HBG8_9ASCO|nr:hypothetical protein PUMCH_003229 [[Candida] saopauloensis]
MESARSKLSRFLKWEELDGDENYDDIAIPGPHGKRALTSSASIPRMSSMNLLPENLETLRISPRKSGLSPPAFQLNHKSNHLGSLGRFAESEEEDYNFEDDIGPQTFTRENLHKPTENYGYLPASFESLSPALARIASADEDEDTDVTRINEDGFEGVENIFGKDESGILETSTNEYVSPRRFDANRAKEALARQEQERQRAAEAENQEWLLRHQRKYEDALRTLTRKDLQRYAKAVSKKPSMRMNVRYEEDEAFQDGFEEFPPDILSSENLSQFKSYPQEIRPSLSYKASMPSFQHSRTAVPTKPRKSRSNMDFASTHGNQNTKRYNERINSATHRFQGLNKVSQSSENQERDLYLQKRKRAKELLRKYLEAPDDQFEVRTSPSKHVSLSRKKHQRNPGIVKNLNRRSTDPGGFGEMRYNPVAVTWEGNEHDLLRFEDDAYDAMKTREPSLIKSRDFLPQKERIGNMVYDAENLRWINLDAETEDGLKDLPDLVPNDMPQYVLPRSTSKRLLGARGVSVFTQRTILSTSSGSSSRSVPLGDEFFVSDKLQARFEKEEAKIKRKTHEWFDPNEHYSLRHPRPFNHDYFWEIRNMVEASQNKR